MHRPWPEDDVPPGNMSRAYVACTGTVHHCIHAHSTRRGRQAAQHKAEYTRSSKACRACTALYGANSVQGFAGLQSCGVALARALSRALTCMSCSFWCRRCSRSWSCLLIASSSAFSDRAPALRLCAPPLLVRLRCCSAVLSGNVLLSALVLDAVAAALRSMETGTALSTAAILLAVSLLNTAGLPSCPAWLSGLPR